MKWKFDQNIAPALENKLCLPPRSRWFLPWNENWDKSWVKLLFLWKYAKFLWFSEGFWHLLSEKTILSTLAWHARARGRISLFFLLGTGTWTDREAMMCSVLKTGHCNIKTKYLQVQWQPETGVDCRREQDRKGSSNRQQPSSAICIRHGQEKVVLHWP